METNPRMTRILFVDDHALVRTSVCRALKQYFEIVAEVGDAPTAVRLASEQLPDVVLIDVGLPDKEDGLWATRKIVAQAPACKILALSGHHDHESVTSMFKAGALGYFCKSSSLQELINAINQVASGQMYIDSEISGNPTLRHH